MSEKKQKRNEIKGIPEPTIRRLPSYIHHLKLLKIQGRDIVSGRHLSRDLNLDPTQVAKDLFYIDISGKTGVGFNIDELIDAIENFLGWNNTNDVFLIGAGHLGSAITGYETFKNYGLNIVYAFDNDPNIIGKTVHEVEVLNVDRFIDLAKRMHISIGIIAVPPSSAQNVADIMSQTDIKAIWNFSPVSITVDEQIFVQNEWLHSSIAVIMNKIKQ